MITILIIIACIVVYILSVLYQWRWIHKVYSTKGKWQDMYPDYMDFAFTILPIANTLMVVLITLWVSPMPPKSKGIFKTTDDFLTRFFKTK